MLRVWLTGGAIASWPDASSNGDPAVQATGDKKPTFIQSGFNGRPVVRRDSANTFMAFTAVSTIRTAIFVLSECRPLRAAIAAGSLTFDHNLNPIDSQSWVDRVSEVIPEI
jgi:hypothetical protein